MESNIAPLYRDSSLVQRALKLWLIAQQHIQRLWLLYGDFDACWGVRGAVDLDLHLPELRRIEPHCQPLGAVRCVPYLHEGRRDLSSWGRPLVRRVRYGLGLPRTGRLGRRLE